MTRRREYQPHPKHIREIARFACESNDPDSMDWAMSELNKMGDEGYVAVADTITDRDVEQLLLSAGELSHLYIKNMLMNDQHKVIQAALGLASKNNICAIDEYAHILENFSEYNFSSTAVTLLASCGEKGFQILENAYNSDNDGIRWMVTKGLSQYLLNPKKVTNIIELDEPLIKLLQLSLADRNRDIKAESISTLAKIRRISIDSFAKALNDPDIYIRLKTVRSLFTFGIDENTSILLARAYEDENGKLIDEAIGILDEPQYDLNFGIVSNAVIDELIIRKNGLTEEGLNPDITANVLKITYSKSPPLYGQQINRLTDLAYGDDKYIRSRSIAVGRRIGEQDFIDRIRDNASENPDVAKELLAYFGISTEVDALIDQISEIEPKDIQAIAASQSKILERFNRDALEQAQSGFNRAAAMSILGFICLLISIAYVMITSSIDAVAIIAGISSGFAQFISATLILIYRDAQKERKYYHRALNQTQNYLLANSICESLEGEAKTHAQEDLIKRISEGDLENITNQN